MSEERQYWQAAREQIEQELGRPLSAQECAEFENAKTEADRIIAETANQKLLPRLWFNITYRITAGCFLLGLLTIVFCDRLGTPVSNEVQEFLSKLTAYGGLTFLSLQWVGVKTKQSSMLDAMLYTVLFISIAFAATLASSR
jgi:hypothetical protein